MRLVGISYDPTSVLSKFSRKRGIEYTLLSDPGSKTIDAYGARNKEATGRTAGIPHPTIFIVDREAVIRFKLRHEGYKERPAPEEIIAAAETLGGERD